MNYKLKLLIVVLLKSIAVFGIVLPLLLTIAAANYLTFNQPNPSLVQLFLNLALVLDSTKNSLIPLFGLLMIIYSTAMILERSNN